ncbi:Putative type-1 restriction enzyme specificity protein MG438 [Elizabethkingia miricola]|nr:Putative type-1 restriction enzyme specificity protein MG438 [Elizabethkingia miricola]
MENDNITMHEGWNINKLGSICTIKKGIQFNKLDLQDAGVYPCINGGIEPSGWTDLWNTNAETITISEGGNSCGYVNFIETKFWSGGHCYSLLDINSQIDKKFLYQALKGKQNFIMDLRVGSGLPNIQQKAIRAFQFIYPISINEQRKIAEILTKVDEAIENTEALIQKYERIKVGLMQDLLTKGIDENDNIRSEETHQFKDSPLGRIPVEWDVNFISKYAHEVVVGIVIKPTQYYIESGVPMLRSQNIKPGKIIMEDLVYMSEANNDKLGKSKLKENDIVSVRTGYPGVTSIVTKKQAGINCIDLVITRIKTNLVNPNYLVNFINSQIGKKQILNQQSGIAQQHFNVGDMKNLLFFIPSINEQNKIVKMLDKLTDKIESLLNNKSKLQLQKQGLMQDLLSGKIRVNYE